MRAQELPLSTIVIAALAIVLVFFIFAFAINLGGLRDVMLNIFSTYEAGMSIASLQQRCELLCAYAINFDPCATEAPEFCSFSADTSKDGGNEYDFCNVDEPGNDVVKVCTVNDKFGESHILDTGGCSNLPYLPSDPKCQ